MQRNTTTRALTSGGSARGSSCCLIYGKCCGACMHMSKSSWVDNQPYYLSYRSFRPSDVSCCTACGPFDKNMSYVGIGKGTVVDGFILRRILVRLKCALAFMVLQAHLLRRTFSNRTCTPGNASAMRLSVGAPTYHHMLCTPR